MVKVLLMGKIKANCEFCVFLCFSAADVGELLQCEMGHQSAGHVHRRQTAGARPHHRHGHRADLQG